MLTRKSFLLVALILIAVTAAQARSKLEINAFGGFRFGGSFHDGGYQNNYFVLEDLDIAPGAQFGASLNIPLGAPNYDGGTTLFELLFNFQGSDLRFAPPSMSALPDSITERFETDGDKLILGEVNVMYIHGGLIYRFGSNSGWYPHVNLGLGATVFKATDGDLQETKFSLSLGGGVIKMFNETFGGRLQLRGYFTSLPAQEYWLDYYGNVWETGASNLFFQGEISGGIVIAF